MSVTEQKIIYGLPRPNTFRRRPESVLCVFYREYVKRINNILSIHSSVIPHVSFPKLVGYHRHHHHHQWCYSPINEPWPSLGFLFLRRFSPNLFLQCEVVSVTPNPQPGGPSLRIYTPGDRVAQQYPLDNG
jgi:hypothetical protein